MEFEQYDYEPARPRPPLFWVGLTTFFALCCCFWATAAATEGVLFLGGFVQTNSGPLTSSKYSIGDIKFYTAQTSASEPAGRPVTTVPTTTKALYAYFTYKNMPKTGLSWSYLWTLNGVDVPGAAKSGLRWTREGNGMWSVLVSDDKALKPGEYELTLMIGDEEQTASIRVGP